MMVLCCSKQDGGRPFQQLLPQGESQHGSRSFDVEQRLASVELDHYKGGFLTFISNPTQEVAFQNLSPGMGHEIWSR